MTATTASVGRLCRYCEKPVTTADRVACCDRCCSVQHEECWDRNGRCSTFRCPGAPRTMLGADLAAVLQTAAKTANDHPRDCPFCSGTAYAGVLQAAKPSEVQSAPAGPGLLFIGEEPGDGLPAKLGKKLLGKLRGTKRWWLPGAQVRARSCGRCKRLYLWGVAVDEAFVKNAQEQSGERFCPHCSEPLWTGKIALDERTQGFARFECDQPPNLHKGWFGRNVLDRYVFNRWQPAVSSLPAQSCAACQYTEIAGHPIYRFS